MSTQRSYHDRKVFEPTPGDDFNPKKWLYTASLMKCVAEGIDGRPLSTTARTTLMLLLNYVNPESGFAWPSQETLASELRRDVRTVKRVIRELIQAGYIRTRQQVKNGKKFGYANIKRNSPILKATRSTAGQNIEVTGAGQECPSEPGDIGVTQNSEGVPKTSESPSRSVVENETFSLPRTAPGSEREKKRT